MRDNYGHFPSGCPVDVARRSLKWTQCQGQFSPELRCASFCLSSICTFGFLDSVNFSYSKQV